MFLRTWRGRGRGRGRSEAKGTSYGHGKIEREKSVISSVEGDLHRTLLNSELSDNWIPFVALRGSQRTCFSFFSQLRLG